MIIGYRILKEDKLVLFLQVGLIILLLSAISITPCFSSSPTLTTIIGILSSIIGSIITATIIVYFTISKSLIIPIKWTFEKLHSDIISNAETLSLFPDQCEELKNNWLNGNSTGFYSESGRKWLPKFSAESYNPENSVKYSWRYLKIGNYPILYDNQKLSEIEGLGFKSDKISLFWGYPQLCHQFCDYIQELESEGNIYSTYIGILKSKGVEKEELPRYFLINNKYVQNGTIDISKADCILQINQLVSKMKYAHTNFMEKFSQIYTISKKSDKEKFFNSLFT